MAVAAAAGVGAVLRYVVDQVVQHRTSSGFPYGTLLVNASGSLLLGVVTGLGSRHGLAPQAALVLGAGVLGGYTTLSTWAWESLALAERGELVQAAVNVGVSVVVGLAAAAAGLGLAML